MKNVRYSYLLWVLAAVLLVGFYTIDFGESEQASMFTMPDFAPTTDVENAVQQTAPSLKDLNDAIVNIAEQTNPTVVTVRVSKLVERQNPFARFFGNRSEPEQERLTGQGSGVIVSQDGYILTNNHVVADADEVEVKFYNDKRTTAEVVGTDPQTDIAVLKVDTEDLHVIELGDSEQTRVGELVLAIGSPLQPDLAQSVSMGIISAKDRNIGILAEQGGYERFIQTDAAINPGNSGGALVNMNGELVGINTAIASRSGGNDGIGFAVPVNIAKSVMESIIEHGRVLRGYLGISDGGEVDGIMAKALDLNKPYGVIVGEVTEDSPAEEAGLQKDDVIQTIGGEPIRSWAAFRTAIGTSSPGDEVELAINRNGETRDITITLGEWPEEEMATSQNQPANDKSMNEQLGFGARNLTPEIARQLQLNPGIEGVVVTEVNRGSSARRQGLQRGDVITGVNRQPVGNISDFREAISAAADNDEEVILLNVNRQGYSR